MNARAERSEERADGDRQLVLEARAGNNAAFDRLVLKYQDQIFNLCFRMLGDYDEANDCAQETFIKVYSNIKGFKFKSGFSTWLYRIAVNTCRNNISSLSTRMRKKMTRLDNPCIHAESDERRKIEILDESSNPADIYERKERDILIQKAIEALSVNERAVIVLCDIEGKSYEEISEITGFKEGTVKSRLSRARRELRTKLRGAI